MTIAANRMTLEEYLIYDDGTDARHELVDGVLIEMGSESPLNQRIALFILFTLAQFLPLERLYRGAEIKTARATSRIPDAMVLTAAGAIALEGQARTLITPDMPPPLLVIEVVSPGEPGEKNYDRDYIEKRQEYSARGIPEYWLIDPQRQIVWVLTLQETGYQEQSFIGQAAIVSSAFPTLTLTAHQILTAGR